MNLWRVCNIAELGNGISCIKTSQIMITAMQYLVRVGICKVHD